MVDETSTLLEFGISLRSLGGLCGFAVHWLM
jgi:hypothetical protein